MSIPVVEKRRGRPPGEKYAPPVPIRLTADQLTAIDEYRRKITALPSRSEAVRQLIERSLEEINMAATLVRIYTRTADGHLEDTKEVYELSNFGGIIPIVGDRILNPWSPERDNRNEPDNRRFYKVLERVFNPRDSKDYIVLICEESPCEDKDRELLPPF